MTDSNIRILLLSALRGEFEQTSTEPSALLSTDEWRKLLDLARLQGITPLLYQKLKMLQDADIPPETIQELRDYYLTNLVRNMQLFHQLKGILKRFHEDNIPVIPLKGSYLAERVYGNIGVRPMSDIDILVKQEDLSHVEEILTGSGFIQERGRRAIYDVGYTRTQNKLLMYIEVHWDISQPLEKLPFGIDKVWDQSRPSEISGIPVRELSPEDLLLHLAVHGSKHVFCNGLRMVFDIAETVKHFENKVDWQHLQQTAQRWGATKSLYVGLRLAAELFYAPVPDSFMDVIKPMNVEPSYHALLHDLLFSENESESQTESIAPVIANIWTTKDISGKVKQLCKRLFLSRQEMALIYGVSPDSLRILLYYPAQLKYLLNTHGRTVWRLVRKDELMEAGAERQSEVNELRKWLLSG